MRFAKDKRLIVFVVIELLIGFFIGYQAALLILSLLLTYLVVQNMLSGRLFSSKFYKLIVSIVLYFAILQSVVLAAWLFDHNYPLNISILITTVLLILVCLWEKFFGKRRGRSLKSESLYFIKTPDAIAIVIGIFITLLIVGAPVVKSLKDYGDINISAITVSMINTNLDDASHLSRVNDRLQLDRGVLYESNKANGAILKDSISIYPPGWYIANAVLIKSMDPAIKVGGQSMVAYVFTKIFWAFILTFLFCRVIYDLYIFFRPKKKQQWLNGAWVWLVGASAFFSYYIIVEQFKEGFYTFIPVLISLLIAIPLFIQLAVDKEMDISRRTRTLLPIILIIAGLTFSWFLILPAVAIGALIALLYPGTKSNFRGNLLYLWEEIKNVFPLLIVVALGILTQLIIITAPSSQSFKTGVDTPGAIAVQSLAFFGFVFIGILLFFIFLQGKLKRTISNVTFVLMLLFAFSLFIYLFQFATIHGPQYYFFKTLDTALIVAVPLSIVGWLYLLEVVVKDLGRIPSAIFACGLLVSLPLIIGVQFPNDPGLLKYVAGRRSTSSNEDVYFYNSISTRAKVPLQKRNNSVVFDIPGDIGANIISTNILRSFEPVNTCDNSIFSNLLVDNQSGLFSTIKNCQPEPVTILTNSASLQTLSNLANNYNISNNIKLLVVN